MRCLGIDPSKTSFGWAVFDIPTKRFVASGSVPLDGGQRQSADEIDPVCSGVVVNKTRDLVISIVGHYGPEYSCIEQLLNTNYTYNSMVAIHTMSIVYGAAAAELVALGVRVWAVNQSVWRPGVGVLPAPKGKGKGKTEHNKREAMRLCRLHDGKAPPTHDEAEARLIARWLAGQIKQELQLGTLPLVAASNDR